MRRQTQLASLLVAGGLVVWILKACSTISPKAFDSRNWKAGNASSRGAMVQDLIDRKIIVGKAPEEVRDLLGQPDYQQVDWYGYKVVTIPRCRLWECRMDVGFDDSTKRVDHVAVSD